MPDLSLVERLQKVSGPDRELDKAVAKACGFAVEKPTGDLDDRDYVSRGPDAWWGYLPRYTASLDAALTLVPEGMQAGMVPYYCEDPRRVEWEVTISRPNWDRWNPVDQMWIDFWETRHKTREIAIILAALKARGIK